MYSKAPAVTMKPKDAKRDGFKESHTEDPTAYLKTEKPAQENKPMIADVDMPTPLVRQIHAVPKIVTENKEMDKVDEDDDGLVIYDEGDKLLKFESGEYGKTANISQGG